MRCSPSINRSFSIAISSIAVLAACASGAHIDDGASGSGGSASCPGGGDCAGGRSSSSSSSSSSGTGGACPLGDCECAPGSTKSCYTGPAGTESVGPCHAGTATCDSSGRWESCDGEVVPSGNECEPGDCNGVACPSGTPLRGATQTGTGTAIGQGVATDGAGNVFVSGSFSGTVDFGCGPMTSPGSDDGFLIKLSPTLTCVWSKPFGASLSAGGAGVAVDAAGNVVVTGGFENTVDLGGGILTTGGSYDVLLAKFDPNGQHLWSKRFGADATQKGFAVAVDGSGNVFLTGLQDGNADYGGGLIVGWPYGQTFLAKFDPSGAPLWSKGFIPGGQSVGTALAVDASGNVALTGWFVGTIDFGVGTLTSAGQDDIYVAKLDGNGSALWSKRFGDISASQEALEVAFDGAGNLGVAGALAGAADFGGGWLSASSSLDAFAAKLDSDGNHVWSKAFGGVGDVRGLALDAAGNVFLAGVFAPTIDFGGGPLTSNGPDADLYFAKLDPSGSHLYSASYGTSEVEDTSALAADGAGHVFMTGAYFGHTLDFGAGPLTSTASPAFYVAEFAP